MAGKAVVIGYETKGRSVIRTLRRTGLRDEPIVVVDVSAEAVAEANAGGLVAVGGDGTRRGVLSGAEIGSAAQIVIAVNRDDTAVLISLTARQLNPCAAIVAAVREEENRQLLRPSGAGHVVVSSDAAGQMLAVSAVWPAAGMVIGDLRDPGAAQLAAGDRLILVSWSAQGSGPRTGPPVRHSRG